MRSVLVWVIYGIIPQEPITIRYLLNSVAFLGYLGLVTWLSILWRDNIDSRCSSVAQEVEHILLGKKTMMETLSSVRIGMTMKEGDIELGSGWKTVLQGFQG
jgi:hypothetical protein